MGLNSDEKERIVRLAQSLPPEEIASQTGIRKSEVTAYLQKRWRPEKYHKYLRRFQEAVRTTDFSFRCFFKENKHLLAILAFLVFASYFNGLSNGFTSDDVPTIAKESRLAEWSYVFSTPSGFLQRIIYHFAYAIGGSNPVLFRLPNLVFHVGAVWAAFWVLTLLGPVTLAFMAAALFAVHPILAESVVWISGGLYVQMGFFFLVSFALYILSEKRRNLYYWSLAFYLLSMTASEKAVVLFLILIGFELSFRDILRNWKRIIPFVGISLLAAILFFSRMGDRIYNLKTQYYLDPGTDSLLIKIPTSIFSYLHLLVWPDKLTLYHTEMLFTPWQYRGTVLLFILYAAAATYFFFRKRKPLAFWMTFLIIPLLPTLSPVRIAWAVAERYIYLGTLGFLVVLAWIFYALSEKKQQWKMPVYALFWLIVLLFGYRTFIRNQDWKNEETLWTATEITSPSGSTIHNNMGAIYQAKGENEKALEEFRMAIAINPRYGDAYHNMGNTYYQMQMMPEAAEAFRKAIELNPLLWQSHQNLAAIYFNQGWYDLAKEEIDKALALNPGDPNLLKNQQLIEASLPLMGTLSTSPPQ